MKNSQLKIITILTLLFAFFLAIVSYYGAFVLSTYERDAASMAAQGIGQDIVDLFLVVPLLLISLLLMHRKNKRAYFIFSGTVFYILYSFFIYSFGVHFNNLFLLYCLILGLSLYVFILLVSGLNGMEIEDWFPPNIPVRSIATYFIFIALMFYLLWLKDIVPAIISNTIPKSVSDYNLLVNPVHVLDIAFTLPGLIITAILLLKKQRLGLILTPVFLVFTIILTIALIAMVIMLKIKGINDETSVAGIFVVLSIIGTVLLSLFLKNVEDIGSTK